MRMLTSAQREGGRLSNTYRIPPVFATYIPCRGKYWDALPDRSTRYRTPFISCAFSPHARGLTFLCPSAQREYTAVPAALPSRLANQQSNRWGPPTAIFRMAFALHWGEATKRNEVSELACLLVWQC